MPVTWPSTLGVSAVAWEQNDLSTTTARAASGATQAVEVPGGYWRVTLTLSLYTSIFGVNRWALWRGFVAQMRGHAGIVDLPRFESFGFSGVTATFNVDAALGATSIQVAWSGGIAPYVGADFGTGSHVYRIAAVTGGSSPYTLTIWPPLRAARTATTALKFSNATAEMRFAPGAIPQGTRDAANIKDILEVSFIEHID